MTDVLGERGDFSDDQVAQEKYDHFNNLLGGAIASFEGTLQTLANRI